MKHRIATAIAATALVVGLAAPAQAAPPPSNPPVVTIPGQVAPLPYYIDPVVTLPTCKQISRVPALLNSTSAIVSLGDTSNELARTGYGTELAATTSIIEDGGHSCTFTVGTKNQLIISVTPMSGYDRSVVETQYNRQYGTSPTNIGGRNAYVGGRTARWQEVSFLLEDGVWVSGKVLSTGDIFPAVLQDVSDLVYTLNH